MISLIEEHQEKRNALELLIFDSPLRDALSKGKVIHIFGEAGTGRTTLALQIATKVGILNKKIFFLDTEGKVTGQKISELITQENFKLVNKNLKLFVVNNFSEQQKLIQRLDYFFLKQKVSLIIVDTITNLYRQAMLFQKDAKNLYEKLAYQVGYFYKIAKIYSIPILLINQATMKKHYESEEMELLNERVDPVARAIMKYWCDREIILVSHGWGNFEARIPGEFKGRVKFTIDTKGVTPLDE